MNRYRIMMRAALLAAVAALAPTPPALAQDPAATPAPAPAPAKKKERKAGGTLSEGTYRQMERITDLIAKNKNAEALEKANTLLERVSSDYERAIVYQHIAFINANQNNLKGALRAFEEALKLDALPQLQYEQMLYNVGQIYYADEQHDRAIAKLQQYLAEASAAPPPADAYIMLASALTEKKQFRQALPYVDQAISKTDKPKESWLQLKLALHFELKEWAQCADVLVRLIQIVPNKEDYWKQLSSVFFEIKKDQESLAVLALAERQGFINEENEIRNLANVYLLLEIPYKAAVVLQRGLDQKVLKADEKTLTLLGDAWTMAREYNRAEPILKQAAAISEKGDIYFRLGQIYIEDEQWKPALEMMEKALTKQLKNPGDATFLAGVASYQLKDRSKAISYFQKATAFDSSRSEATQWINHVRSEIEQQEQAALVAAQAREAEAADKKSSAKN